MAGSTVFCAQTSMLVVLKASRTESRVTATGLVLVISAWNWTACCGDFAASLGLNVPSRLASLVLTTVNDSGGVMSVSQHDLVELLTIAQSVLIPEASAA